VLALAWTRQIDAARRSLDQHPQVGQAVFARGRSAACRLISRLRTQRLRS